MTSRRARSIRAAWRCGLPGSSAIVRTKGPTSLTRSAPCTTCISAPARSPHETVCDEPHPHSGRIVARRDRRNGWAPRREAILPCSVAPSTCDAAPKRHRTTPHPHQPFARRPVGLAARTAPLATVYSRRASSRPLRGPAASVTYSTAPGAAGRCDAGVIAVGIDSVETGDAGIVRRVLGGDPRAYAVLVARYRDRLGRYALHMLGNVEDAEEALQDAFIRGYRSLHRCNGPERFGAWLYGILVNCCRTAAAPAAKRGRGFLHDDILLRGAAR